MHVKTPYVVHKIADVAGFDNSKLVCIQIGDIVFLTGHTTTTRAQTKPPAQVFADLTHLNPPQINVMTRPENMNVWINGGQARISATSFGDKQIIYIQTMWVKQ